PEANERCWNDESPDGKLECWQVTLLTPITLKCIDQGPHPVDHSQACFKIELDGQDATDEYCNKVDGSKNDDGYCCISEKRTFYFGEETEHKLEYYCIDKLQNKGEVKDIEFFKVEGTKFDIPLYRKWNLISVPFVLLNDNPDVVFGDTPGVTVVWTYDPEHRICEETEGDWCLWTPDGPKNIKSITPGWGYWVLETGEDMECVEENHDFDGFDTLNDDDHNELCAVEILTIGGSLFSPVTTPPSRNLVKGWNLIGYYGTSWELYRWVDYEPTCEPGFNWFPGKYVYGDKVYCALSSLIDTQEGYPKWSSLWSYINCGDHNAYWLGLNACPVGIHNMIDRMYAGRGYWIEMDVDDLYSPATTCIWNSDFKCKWTGGGVIP
ncbi:MAG: hypothetical protein DRP11_03245, partial [Candidatus Aenigmatarchaeota archaeon]